ncbi:MAG: helix-turn-helix transcriptional regulator [Alphaproteobacteria bacterium]|nr:helix-turn-helix transcriptional regulator [Alphaproteobacteria bacterium]
MQKTEPRALGDVPTVVFMVDPGGTEGRPRFRAPAGLADASPALLMTARGREPVYVVPAAQWFAMAQARPTAAPAAAAEAAPVAASDEPVRLVVGPMRTLRRARGLTLDGLAGRVGVSKAYLSEIETGKKPGSLKTLRRVATALEIDVRDLIAT